MIVCVAGTLQIHRLAVASEGELEELRQEIEEAVRRLHPDYEFDDDVSLVWDEYAGKPEDVPIITEEEADLQQQQ